MKKDEKITSFEHDIDKFSLNLENNLQHLQEIWENILSLRLNRKHNGDIPEIGFILWSAVLWIIAWKALFDVSWGKTAWFIMIFYFFLIYIAYRKSFWKSKYELMKAIESYIDSKNNIIINTRKLSLSLKEYTQSEHIDPIMVDRISQEILSYSKNMRTIYSNYEEIHRSNTDTLKEYQGYKKQIQTFFAYEDTAFQDIINWFNIIFGFWIRTHISKISTYQDVLSWIESHDSSYNAALDTAIVRLDKNIELFEKIQLGNHN